MPELQIEYACRFTGWAIDPASGESKMRAKYDFTGRGEGGLREARRLVADTRAWQPHHDLPVDAVVVSRPVTEWAVVDDDA